MKIDYSNTSDTIPEGKYEFIVKTAKIGETNGGAKYICVLSTIRNDAEQNHKNRSVRHLIWRKKEPNQLDRAFDGFNSAQINTIFKSCKVPNGKTYSNFDEMFADLTGRTFKAELYHDNYNGSVSEKLRNINETDFPECGHIWSEKTNGLPTYTENINIPGDPDFNNQSNMEEISTDDDLPF